MDYWVEEVRVLQAINWIDLFILILSSFRITHLIVFDEIAAIIRKPFIEELTQVDSNGQIENIVTVKGKGLQKFIGKLLSCYWCTGFWCSVGVVIAYFYLPIVFPLLVIFAVAGAASILESKI